MKKRKGVKMKGGRFKSGEKEKEYSKMAFYFKKIITPLKRKSCFKGYIFEVQDSKCLT
ncbi:MAG: hypothetical protein QE493_04825 [Verrucomicrobiae bacterium]|jgi:hypothetical protein|nr:hypothetical protein [Verrucomicrobiae bacterium]